MTGIAERSDLPPPMAAGWLRNRLGEYHVVRNHRPGGERTGVWELGVGDATYFFKLNRRRIRWATELFAYRRWTPRLAPHVPELCGVLDANDTWGLLLSALDGKPLRDLDLADNRTAPAYRRAGELLARFHGLEEGPWFGVMDEHGRPTDDTCSSDPADHYCRVLEGALDATRHADALEIEEERTARRVIAALADVDFRPPVPTFFDYTPANWIAGADGALAGIIDFENMGWGLPADPFARLCLDYFPSRPLSRRAFYEGYGRNVESDRPLQLAVGCLLYALYYKAQGALRGRPDMTERARNAFTRCAELATG